jgi:hypothetical protein
MHPRGWRSARPWHGVLLTVLLMCSPLYAQTVDVTASLDLTDGYARAGAYVPVRLKATNRTGETVTSLRLRCDGPVDVASPWRLAPGESGEKVVPAFYVGGELRPAMEFRDAAGKAVSRAAPAAISPRVAPPGAALVSLGPDDPDPSEERQAWLRKALRADAIRFVRQSAEACRLSARCGVLDASIQGAEAPGAAPAVVLLRPFPAGSDDLTQPAAYKFLSSRPWGAQDRLHLWLWLAGFAMAVLAACVILPRRRAVLAAVLVSLAAAAAALISLFGGLDAAKVQEARIFYVVAGRPPAAMEHFALLQSRGKAAATFYPGKPGLAPLPLPVLAAPEDLFRPMATLHYGDSESVETRSGQAIFHIMDRTQPPLDLKFEKAALPDLATVAKRADVVAALSVDGNRATDAAGRSLTLDAWAVEWKAAADPDLAYAGRSLAWWDDARREGDGPALLVWLRDPLPPGEADSENRTRLPAMAICTPE